MIISASHKLVQFMRQDEGQKKMSTIAPGCVHAHLTSDQCKKCKLLCNKNNFFFFLHKLCRYWKLSKVKHYPEVKAIQNCVVHTTVVWVNLFSTCMVIKLILTQRHYQIKILNSEVTAAGTRTSVKAPSCFQEGNGCPSTRNSGMSEQDTHLRHSSHPHREGEEVEALTKKAAVHILLVLCMLTLWHRGGSALRHPVYIYLLYSRAQTHVLTHAQNRRCKDSKPRNTPSTSTLNFRKHFSHLVGDLTIEYFATTSSYYTLGVFKASSHEK